MGPAIGCRVSATFFNPTFTASRIRVGHEVTLPPDRMVVCDGEATFGPSVEITLVVWVPDMLLGETLGATVDTALRYLADEAGVSGEAMYLKVAPGASGWGP